MMVPTLLANTIELILPRSRSVIAAVAVMVIEASCVRNPVKPGMIQSARCKRHAGLTRENADIPVNAGKFRIDQWGQTGPTARRDHRETAWKAWNGNRAD